VKVYWADTANQHRAEIIDYIAADNPRAALKMDRIFTEAADKLADFPMLGRKGDLPGTREILPHESYRLIYEIDGDCVRIVALVHTARRWPPVRR